MYTATMGKKLHRRWKTKALFNNPNGGTSMNWMNQGQLWPHKHDNPEKTSIWLGQAKNNSTMESFQIRELSINSSTSKKQKIETGKTPHLDKILTMTQSKWNKNETQKMSQILK